MKKIIGIIIIVIAMGLGYMGITKIGESTASVEIVGIELSASDEGGQTTGYIYLGLAVISFIGGIVLVSQKS